MTKRLAIQSQGAGACLQI